MYKQENPLSSLRGRPAATATIKGSTDYPEITGTVQFFNTSRGVLVAAQIWGLPAGTGACAHPVFGFHIHEGGACTGDAADPFAAAMTHYNPRSCPHPYHAGDLPPLFGNKGHALSIFLTDRFSIEELLGKTVIIHSRPDDFTTQPAGNAGDKIACGVILR